MVSRYVRLALQLGAVAVVAGGCRGCLRENIVWEHTFNRPDCRPRPVAGACGCDMHRRQQSAIREYPQFELPPGGPYHSTPAVKKTYEPQ